MPLSRRALGVLVAVLLGACAARTQNSVIYIERGQFVFQPETVDAGAQGLGTFVATISVANEPKQIVVLASECHDGMGNLNIVGDGLLEPSQILVFARGDRPPDRLFAEICSLGARRQAEKHKPG
jgi:hypothetical protein